MAYNVKKQDISLEKTGFFSRQILDYLSGNPALSSFYSYPPDLKSFNRVIGDRQKKTVDRKILVEMLTDQYKQSGIVLDENSPVYQNIQSLRSENTFTVTTGHQLCLFTGPLYSIYKILTTIKLANEVTGIRHPESRIKNPELRIIPVYWMVSEDHDFEEINHINLYGKKLVWNAELGVKFPPAGKIATKGIASVIEELKSVLGTPEAAGRLIALFKEAYVCHSTMADATRWLAHSLFEQYGLVILDSNDTRLKKFFIPVMQDDIFENKPCRLINSCSEKLGKMGYKTQINPREINVFYLTDQFRERIVYDDAPPAQGGGKFNVLNSDLSFSKPEMEKIIEEHPERFSPNVAIRPLFQETVLPNLAYIGGSNELAYWLQMKELFDHYEINFPMLVLRNSFLWIDKVSADKMEKFRISAEELFLPEEELVKNYVLRNSIVEISLEKETREVKSIYESLAEKGGSVDATLRPAIEAEMQKTVKSLHGIEEKIIRAGKKKHETEINQIRKLKRHLFPPDGTKLQERYDNFSNYFSGLGKYFFELLMNNSSSLSNNFTIISER